MDPEVRQRYLDEQIDPIVKRVGWAVQCVFPTGDDPRRGEYWGYTVGLTGRGWPELALSGMQPEQTTAVLNLVVQHFIDIDRRPTPGEVRDVIEPPYTLWLRICDTRDPNYPFAIAIDYAAPVPILGLQVVWQDDAQRFPWDDGYDFERFDQVMIETRKEVSRN